MVTWNAEDLDHGPGTQVNQTIEQMPDRTAPAVPKGHIIAMNQTSGSGQLGKNENTAIGGTFVFTPQTPQLRGRLHIVMQD